MAIVGGGFGVRVALPCLRAAGFAVHALTSRRPGDVTAEAAAHGVPRVVERWQELLGDPSIDLMMIATPPGLHAEMAIEALGSGHHLLCEKPLARSASEARSILDAGQAAGTGVLQAVDHELRFHPPFRKIRDIIAAGDIGAVRHVTAHYCTSTRVDPNIRWGWWDDVAAGGGQLNALGSHLVDTLRWWLDDEVVRATGALHSFIDSRLGTDGIARPVTADDYAAFTLTFSRSCEASVVVSAVDPTNAGLRVDVVGESGSLRLDGFDRLSITRLGRGPCDLSQADPLEGQPVIGENPWRRALVRYGTHLVDVLAGNAAFAGATLDDGVQTQMVIDAVRASAAGSRNEEISIA